ncbi:hypothetical protein [Clostridium luticellarii]|jgi:ABC-type transporter Mla subunit MlaD|uniref:Uncharacterized protein n=1 Tax=Clostridium luticellarii TaxID=1691940 RepID=A0A2T0BRX1_9CLOT|nr:hypothetical protein [Clostridium luticellarii]MCI1943656.1 hypothetical protein [Clostridium luticellarii]MCI1968907.1 hypothetical protein [Clostridium luticellarii]MCI1994284.1 hypothetical protein [Clostridium luticellarii]MCI2038763.1 hypothetical protein [Clostridium luticellarii]PRR86638.1 hypothetical protein CLLU_04390 [Clostridium luticellarii]
MLDKQDIEIIKELLQPINDKLDEHSAKLNELQTGQNKHSILLEELKKNMNTVIEGQQAQAEQTDRHFKKLEDNIKDDSTLIKTALKTVSGDVKDLKKTADELKADYEEVKGVTEQNSYDVQSLRNRYKKRSQG